MMKAKTLVAPAPDYRIWCSQCCIRIAPSEEKTSSGGKHYHARCLPKAGRSRTKTTAK